MNPADVNSMITRCAVSFSAVGPPRMRRSRSAGSRRIRSSVISADPPTKTVKYAHACMYCRVPAQLNSSAPIARPRITSASHALAFSVMLSHRE